MGVPRVGEGQVQAADLRLQQDRQDIGSATS